MREFVHIGRASNAILDFVRSQTRERFVGEVLDGDIGRSMPGYRNNARVAQCIDAIWRHFVGRALGTIGPRKPGERALLPWAARVTTRGRVGAPECLRQIKPTRLRRRPRGEPPHVVCISFGKSSKRHGPNP